MASGFESWRAYHRKDGGIVVEDLKNLARLQLTENRIAEASKARDEIALAVESKAKTIKDLTKKRNEVQDRFDLAKREWRDIEESVETKKDELKKWDARMQTLQDWREQQALNSAIREHKRNIEYAETNANEKVAIVEELETAFNEAQGALESVQREVKSLTRQLAKQEKETTTALQSEMAHRESLLGNIPDTDRRRYVTLVDSVKRRPARAVVIARGGICGFCNVSMQPQNWIEVQRLEKVMYCQGCRRAVVHESVMAVGAELEA
jgi:predicted  nucleic acid-binding Zn-ribbon protein